jgi:hypothetical protein
VNKKIKLNFSDFRSDFDKEDNYFTRLLSSHYDLEISDKPDFLIYSCFDHDGKLPWHRKFRNSRQNAAVDYQKYNCIRIFYTYENVRPNFKECDYAFTFDYSAHFNHYRLPLYGIIYQRTQGWPFDNKIHPLTRKNNPQEILQKKTKFCNFLYSNRHGKKRNAFFHKLSEYKPVDSGGKHLNNLGYQIKNKLDFMQQYKFTIAFENYSYPGYTTEKIYDPMLVNSIPIYGSSEPSMLN